MSNVKWGFEEQYAHRHLPSKWHTSSGFSFYPKDPLVQKSPRNHLMPVYREDHQPINTDYNERSQDERYACSAYGCHRNLDWNTSLRSPRNPFPGLQARDGCPASEMRYVGQAPPKTASSWRSGREISKAAQSLISPRDAYSVLREARNLQSVAAANRQDRQQQKRGQTKPSQILSAAAMSSGLGSAPGSRLPSRQGSEALSAGGSSRLVEGLQMGEDLPLEEEDYFAMPPIEEGSVMSR
eukprot:TRINITY_DN25014_c0_g1_i1.p1 TRINITY_DN25014_c0_g1~~TRINITY_DN25014_c0_g1_i1.p1  ORF type:complete len:240 (+),score=34.52 TRINITY_DN25014_c0_g1_i1:80-799(+)